MRIGSELKDEKRNIGTFEDRSFATEEKIGVDNLEIVIDD